MKNKRSSGIFINILILIISILTMVLFLMDYMAKRETQTGGLITSESNVIISSIQAEKIEDINDQNDHDEKKNRVEEIPILSENILLDQKQNAASSEINHYKYYYFQLDDSAKKIYELIEDNIENMKTGTYTLSIPNEVGRILDQENGEQILNQEFQSAWDAIIMDRVDLFYIDVSKITLEIKTTSYKNFKTYKLKMKPNGDTYLEDNFYQETVIDMALQQLENVRDQIVARVSGNDYEKVVQVNQYLIELLEYSTESGDNAYNIYGALMQRKCVCEGYAESFKYIMDALDIPCILVIGEACNSEGNTENHEWNYVQIDGIWYAMDVTWNDPILVGGGRLTANLKEKYLLKGTGINQNHFPNGKISSNGITFTYPTLSNRDY